jgi:FtsP/CotA-like multicopper oxidase with cupredoxin domain
VAEGEPPDDALARYEFPANGRELWRILSASADAYLNLALVDEHGAALSWEVAAHDGVALTDDSGRRLPPRPTSAAQLVPPGGRLEVLVAAPTEGVRAYLISHAVDTGCAGDANPSRRLAMAVAAPAPAAVVAAPPSAPGAAVADEPASLFAELLGAPTGRVRRLAFTEYPRPGAIDATDFFIIELKPGAQIRPFAMNGPPTIIVPVGTVEEWIIENWTREPHAFHTHQLHFRVLEVDGAKLDEPPLLDIVNVPFARPDDGDALIPGRVRIKLMFPAALAGDILFHCHLMEHEDNGMMGVVRVFVPGAPRPVRKAALEGPLLPFPLPICRPAPRADQNYATPSP